MRYFLLFLLFSIVTLHGQSTNPSDMMYYGYSYEVNEPVPENVEIQLRWQYVNPYDNQWSNLMYGTLDEGNHSGVATNWVPGNVMRLRWTYVVTDSRGSREGVLWQGTYDRMPELGWPGVVIPHQDLTWLLQNTTSIPEYDKPKNDWDRTIESSARGERKPNNGMMKGQTLTLEDVRNHTRNPKEPDIDRWYSVYSVIAEEGKTPKKPNVKIDGAPAQIRDWFVTGNIATFKVDAPDGYVWNETQGMFKMDKRVMPLVQLSESPTKGEGRIEWYGSFSNWQEVVQREEITWVEDAREEDYDRMMESIEFTVIEPIPTSKMEFPDPETQEVYAVYEFSHDDDELVIDSPDIELDEENEEGDGQSNLSSQPNSTLKWTASTSSVVIWSKVPAQIRNGQSDNTDLIIRIPLSMLNIGGWVTLDDWVWNLTTPATASDEWMTWLVQWVRMSIKLAAGIFFFIKSAYLAMDTIGL